jgi:hypothetical protein
MLSFEIIFAQEKNKLVDQNMLRDSLVRYDSTLSAHSNRVDTLIQTYLKSIPKDSTGLPVNYLWYDSLTFIIHMKK